MLWCLLEGHADDEPAVAQLDGPIADEEVGEVLDRDLALEGDAAAARGVRAHPAEASSRSARLVFLPARSGPQRCPY